LTIIPVGPTTEGFTGSSSSSESRYEWLTGDEIYDDFYAATHHKIFMQEKLVQAEAAIALHDWGKAVDKQHMSILDVGCGTGIATTYLAKQDVGKSVGIDKSAAMIRYAKNTILPGTTLNQKQKAAVEFRTTDLYGPSAAAEAEFTHCMLLYFSVYAFRDLDTLFRNLYFWTQPGGGLAIEVVDRDKFVPVPDVANPWVGVNPQAHTKERMTRASAVFDKFEYASEFDLDGDAAEFRETFSFKDGTVRRQKHVLYMPKIADIVKAAQSIGWKYTKFTELKVIGFDYGYMLFFVK
jgi:SAM-dependent methyltransferase